MISGSESLNTFQNLKAESHSGPESARSSPNTRPRKRLVYLPGFRYPKRNAVESYYAMTLMLLYDSQPPFDFLASMSHGRSNQSSDENISFHVICVSEKEAMAMAGAVERLQQSAKAPALNKSGRRA